MALLGLLGKTQGARGSTTSGLGRGRSDFGADLLRSMGFSRQRCLTRFLESPSDIYLTSWFSLPGASRRDGGSRGQEAGRSEEQGNIFFPPTVQLIFPTWGPPGPQTSGVSQLLGVKGNKECTGPPHPPSEFKTRGNLGRSN